MRLSGQRLGVETSRPAGRRFRQLVVPLHYEWHPVYGEVSIGPDDVARMAANFARGVKLYAGQRSPVEIAHDEERGAAGWITRVWAAEDGLWAEGEYTAAGLEAVVGGGYPYISPTILERWEDPATGQQFEDVFDGFSLVVRPQFRDLPPASVQEFSESRGPVMILAGKEQGMLVERSGEPATAATRCGQAGEPVTEAVEEAVAGTVTEPVAEPVTGTGEEAVAGTVTEPVAEPVTGTGEEAVAGTVTEPVAEPVAEAQQFSEALGRREAALAAREAALAAERRAFDEAQVAAVRREFGEVVGGLRFGEARITPSSRDALAEVLAEVHRLDPGLARRFGEALAGLRTYQAGEVGLAGRPRPTALDLDPELRKFAEQHGIDDETLRQAVPQATNPGAPAQTGSLEKTTWVR